MICALLAAVFAASSVAELAEAVFDRAEAGEEFDLEVTASAYGNYMFRFYDETGGMVANVASEYHGTLANALAGDRFRIKGETRRIESTVRAYCTSAVFMAHGDPVDVRSVSGSDFISGRYDYLPVGIVGEVVDAVHDEIDSDYGMLVLLADGERIIAPFDLKRTDLGCLKRLVGSRVRLEGICDPALMSQRRQPGRVLREVDFRNIDVIEHGPEDPFEVPRLREFYRLQPEAVGRLSRRKAVGQVLALWGGRYALLACGRFSRVRVEFSGGEVPSVGQVIEAVGLPGTDLYRLTLSRALWRETSEIISIEEPERSVSARDLVKYSNGRTVFNPYLSTHRVRLTGRIRRLPSVNDGDQRIYLEADGIEVPLDITADPGASDGLSVGAEIEVSGVFFLETGYWSSNLVFPSISSAFIAVPSRRAITVVSGPSPFTPARLLALAGLLFVAVVWLFVQNRLSRREAALRLAERTRLAVELHDSIAQSMTGICLELEAADAFSDGAAEELKQHLSTATAALRSCHGELRNCLWDLRNSAMAEKDVAVAIRKVIAPLVKGVRCSVRFKADRALFSEGEMHAVLRIVRELVTNAVRHGHATSVRIAGVRDDREFMFSVTDNGCGFDVEESPGPDTGHFGLDGVRSRAKELGGRIEIQSAPGRGARVRINVKEASA